MRILFIILILFNQAVFAVSSSYTDFALIPQKIQELILQKYPQGHFRIDGCFENEKQVWLPIKPLESSSEQEVTLLDQSKNQALLFSNGWIYIPIINNTIQSFDFFSEAFQSNLVRGQILETFLIPKDFELPRDLAILSGRLPIKLRTVELASEREVQYKKRLQEEGKKNPVEFISYSRSNSGLSFFNIESENGSLGFDDQKLSELNSKISFVSNIRKIGNEIFISDYNKGCIYQIKPRVKEFDARKAEMPEQIGAETEVGKIIDLRDFEINNKLKDFLILKDSDHAYLLTEEPSELIVINLKDKQLIKRVQVKAGSGNLMFVERDSREANRVVFFSKSTNKLVSVSTMDYRISEEISISSKPILPVSFTSNQSDLIIAGQEFINNNSSGVIVFIDTVSGQTNRVINLDFLPSQILNLPKENSILVLGYQSNKDPVLAKLSLDTFTVSLKSNPGVDLNSPSQMIFVQSGALLIIASSTNKILGIVDLKTLELVKKFEIPQTVDLLVDL